MFPANKFKVPKRYDGCSNNIWTEITQLVSQYNPLNLAMGFPDYPPPNYITNTLSKVATDENSLLHQYTRDFGHLRLVTAFAKLYSALLDRDLDPLKEVLPLASGCQALFAVINGHVEEDDEVIILEPYFDFYETLVKTAGGKCKFVPLRLKKKKTEESELENTLSSSDWSFDTTELQNAFSEKSKLFILNTPNNPLGKVFNLKEITVIANLCKQWNVVCVADEVYEFFVFSPNKHIRIASLPGMWERTITVCCPGKTFGVTGWELGIVYGPENLIFNLQIVHQNLVSTCITPIQEAYAILFEKEIERFDTDESIFSVMPRELKIKRDFMVKTLLDAGLKPVIPEGGFLILAHWSSIASRINLNLQNNGQKDFQFTKWMIKNIGLAGIPPSAFFSEPHKHLGEEYIRFCFLKKVETLQKFADALKGIGTK